MKKLLSILIIIMLLCPTALAGTGIVPPANAKYDIENGGFEDGMTGWGFYYHTLGVDTYEVVTDGYEGDGVQLHTAGSDHFTWIMQRNLQLDDYGAISVRYKLTNFSTTNPTLDDTHLTFRFLNDALTYYVCYPQTTIMCRDMTEDEWVYAYMEFDPDVLNVTGLTGWFDILVQTDNSGYSSSATIIVDDVTLYAREVPEEPEPVAPTLNITTYFESYIDDDESITITDEQSDSVTCDDSGTVTFTVDPVNDDVALTIDGQFPEGCQLGFEANNYTMFNDLTVDINGDLAHSLYDIYIDDEFFERVIPEDGSYQYTFSDLSGLSTIDIIEVSSGGSGGGTTTDGDSSNDGDSSTGNDDTSSLIDWDSLYDIKLISEIPMTLNVSLKDFLSNAVNWSVLLMTYIGYYTLDKIRGNKTLLSSVLLYGTIAWIIPLVFMGIGINPFAFNYLLSSSSFFLGALNFYAYGMFAEYMVVSNPQSVTKKPYRSRVK